jgi:MFS transporter, OFA family, oxalate/formate antiporter
VVADVIKGADVIKIERPGEGDPTRGQLRDKPGVGSLYWIFWGWASDRLGRELTMILTFVAQALCLMSVITLGQISGAWFAATLVLVYFTWGQIYSLFPCASADYFGTRNATSNYALLYTAKGMASIIGGWFGALLYEQSGSWTTGFYGSALMALIAAGIAVKLRGSSVAPKPKAAGVPATA